MQYLTYLHFFSSLVYLYLAIFVLLKNYNALINRICCAILVCFCIWSFGVTFVHNPSVSKEIATLFENIGSIGWTTFSSFFLWFALVFTGKKRLARSKYFILSLFIIPLILLYKQWTNELLYGHILQSFGWIGKWSDSIWSYLFYSYYFLLVIIGFFFIFKFRKRTESVLKKHQSEILLISAVIPLVLGTTSNVVMRWLNIYSIPPLGDIFILFWALGLAYAISRYRFLSITPTVAADKIISTMADLLILLDLQGNIVSVNKAALDLLEYDTEELEGRSFEILLQENDIKASIVRKITKGEKLRNSEALLKTRKGKDIPVSLSISMLPGSGTVCIARDITLQKAAQELLQKDKAQLEAKVKERTKELSIANEDLIQEILERKKTEEELRNSEEQLKILFEFAPDAYYINDFSGTFIDGNKKAEELTGYKREELIGKNFLKLKLLSVSQLSKATNALAKNALGKPTGPDEFILNRNGGGKVHVEISTYPIKIKNKKRVLGIARDITPRKQAEEEKKQLEEQLYQAQKMEAIGQLAGGIAHDFNNMLGAISGYADMIKRKFAPNNPQLEKYITRILDAAIRSADLTAKLLTFARKGKHIVTAVNIHETIQSVINLLEHTIDKRITIRQHLNANPSIVMGDNTQLQNAVLNIAVNSLDAMTKGGELKFATDTVDLDETFIHSRPYKIAPGTYLQLSITDTGIGMDNEIKTRVFEPFFTTKEIGRGTGLGLASVYGTVKSHVGFIEVESNVGMGTTFCMYLPLADESSKKSVDVSENIQKGGGTILIVDDEELIREISKDMLTELGFTVITCNNGKEAKNYYKQHYKEIDLLIIDLIMPDLSGYDCFIELKKINPKIKALISSGYAANGEIEKIIGDGALGFLQKPFEIEELSKFINEALN